MNNEPEPKARKKRYDENFKRSAVGHWLGGGKSAEAVAAELSINAQALKIWKQQLAVVPPGNSAPRTVEALEAEHRRRRRELGSLRSGSGRYLKKRWASSHVPATTL